MNPENKKFLLRMIISIFIISIFTVGGCDIEFGGGGGGNNDDEIVETRGDLLAGDTVDAIRVELQ